MPRLLPLPLSACLLALALAAAGCSSDDAPATTSAPASSSATPSGSAGSAAPPSTTPAGSAPASPTAPTSSDAPSAGGRAPSARTAAAPTAHLLADSRLPALTAGATWTEAATGPEDLAVVGTCQKTDLVSIGAVSAVRRTFTDSSGATATQVVATFVDKLSAWQAEQVLISWHDDCAARVAGTTVGPLQPVRVRRGDASHYRVRTADVSAGLGVLRTGTCLTLVEVAGPRAGQPVAWSPAKVALRRIARTFG